MLVKSKHRIDKELDLQRFIKHQRATMFALLSLMSHSQARFVNKLSGLVFKGDIGHDFDSDFDDS